MMKTRISIVLLAICVNIALNQIQYVRTSESPDLYSVFDDVIRLNSTTFVPVVYHQNKNLTYIVQFYNTFCGHCQMFAPIYKDLASRVKNWTSVVRIAGVDCSKDENVITCSENKIDGYPTILIFPPNARIQDPEDKPLNLRKLNIEWNVDDIEEGIINYLTNLTSTSRQYPLVINAFQPVDITDIKNFHRIYPLPSEDDDVLNEKHSIQNVMFIVESEKSYLGRKLMVEYFRISSTLELRRILLSNTLLLKSILKEDDFAKLNDSHPILIRLNDIDNTKYDGVKAQVLVKGEADNILSSSLEHERQDFVYNRFRMFFEHYYSVELETSELNSEVHSHFKEATKQPATNDNEITIRKSDELEIQYLLHNDPIGSKRVFAMDLLKGISFMITHEIKIKGDLTPSQFKTVRNLLTILKKYLPMEKWDSALNKFIVELRTQLDSNRVVYERDGILAKEMRELLELSGADSIRLRYSRENWVSCLESDRHHKGYTCSLWLLFHTLTVGEYFKAAPVLFRPKMVLFTMRDYITEFLGCTVCSSNFEKETEALEENLNSRNSSVFWLWYTHNRINQRLNDEKQNEKLLLSDIIFPSYRRCPQCYNSDIKEVGLDGKTFRDIDWNLTSVLNDLIDKYRPDSVISPFDMASLLSTIRSKVNYDLIEVNKNSDPIGTRRLLKSADMNRSAEQWNIQSIFSTSDISLCLFLYLCCIIIVALVAVALNPKWKRFKTK